MKFPLTKLFALFVCFFMVSCYVPKVQDTRKLIEVEPYLSVVVIQFYTKENKGAFFGSGFAIEDKRIMTAGHVCAHAVMREEMIKEKVELVGIKDGKLARFEYGEIETIDEKKDLCIIKTKKNHNIPVLAIASRDTVNKIFDEVTMVGAPGGAYPARTHGHLMRVHLVTSEDGFFRIERRIVNLAGTKGNSGSPMYNKDNEVVAIMIGQLDLDYDHILVATDLNHIHEFLDENYGEQFLQR